MKTRLSIVIIVSSLILFPSCTPTASSEVSYGEYNLLIDQFLTEQSENEDLQDLNSDLRNLYEEEQKKTDNLQSQLEDAQSEIRRLNTDINLLTTYIKNTPTPIPTATFRPATPTPTFVPTYTPTPYSYYVPTPTPFVTYITPTPTPYVAYRTPTPAPTQTPSNWIDSYYATNHVYPVVPDWLLPLFEYELSSGDRIRPGLTIIRASLQYWNLRSPSQKQQILETVEWLGGNANDYLWSIQYTSPLSGDSLLTWER